MEKKKETSGLDDDNEEQNDKSAPTIKLKVSGKYYEILEGILVKSGYFKSLLSEKYKEKKDDIITINRSSMLFDHIHAYLCDPLYNLPEYCYRELEFYQITPTELTDVKQSEKLTSQEDKIFIEEHKNMEFYALTLTKVNFPYGDLKNSTSNLTKDTIFSYLIRNSKELVTLNTTLKPQYTNWSEQTNHYNLGKRDMISDITIRINKKMVHQIKNVAILIGSNQFIHTIDFILAYNELRQTQSIKQLRNNSDNIILELPFWFCGGAEQNSLISVLLPYDNCSMEIYAENKSNILELMEVNMTYSCISSSNLRSLLSSHETKSARRWKLFGESRKMEKKDSYYTVRYTSRLSHKFSIYRYIIYVLDDDKNTMEIEKIDVRIDQDVISHPVGLYSGDDIRMKMAGRGIYSDKFYYDINLFDPGQTLKGNPTFHVYTKNKDTNGTCYIYTQFAENITYKDGSFKSLIGSD
jgi:hypothetical protein